MLAQKQNHSVNKFRLEIRKSMRSASFWNSLSTGRLRTQTSHCKIEPGQCRCLYRGLSDILPKKKKKTEIGLRGSRELVNLPDPISHILQFSQSHIDQTLQRAVGRVNSSASPRSFTVPLWIWAGWPLHPSRSHAHWLMSPSSLQTTAT